MSLELILDRQVAIDETPDLPNQTSLALWVNTVLDGRMEEAELTIRIVGNEESQQLNFDYRGKDKPTNVLSFPFEAPPEIELPLLGDLIICAPVVAQEANAQNKTLQAHWAHMVVHGCLHLLGYDHIDDAEAEEMESLETQIITQLGFANPYQEL
ncbi:rRNA maturation RNase YbeY [Shewanella surugensis]|uniref:Endoribonuclease YbeY n=1 Tax=Shewanella surugensis TaxID=212020 RepID=A0ABT0L841_9GAMM|nr:rRNA maturation RNase YbeY [Shewanella surugensis]MCL1123823.1 rRNA maturation RNase YbeY [Shewanella surugensis]